MTHEWGRQIDDRSLGGRGRTGREGDYPVLCYSAGGWSERGRARAGGKPRKHVHMHIFPCTCYILYYGGGLGLGIRLSLICLYKAGLEFAPVTSGS